MLKHALKKNGKISEDICLLFDDKCVYKNMRSILEMK